MWSRVPLKRLLPVAGGTVLVLACLAGCGAGHRANPSAGTVMPRSTASPPATSNAKTLTGPPPPAKAYWSYAALIARLAGRTLALSSGTIRLDSALIECNGEGDPMVSGQTRRWNIYTCTQTAFQAGGDHDVTFDVAILNATQLRVTSVRKGPE